MQASTITIPLDAETAGIYRTASDSEKKKLRMLLGVWLREFGKPSAPIGVLMDNISDKAQERGLTPDILDSILRADK